MTRHPDPRTAACRQVSTRAATAAGWALLAAVGVAGLASTSPAAAGARQAHGGVSTVEGVLAASPPAPGGTAQPAVATSQTMIAMAASPTTVAYQSSSYATGDPDSRAAVAVRVAMAQIGLPYVWGGDGPASGDAGFDCSGLTHYAYAAAGISLPRTAHTQFYAGPRVPAGAPLQPGDLVFYGTPARVHHVGMYIGDGRMVNAPTFGEPVQTAYYRWLGDDYVGATRPAASSTASSSALPFIPEPAAPPANAPAGTSDVFVAPRASLPSTLPAPGAVQVPEAQSAQAALTEQQQAGATTLPTTIPTTPAAALVGSTVTTGPNASSAAGTPGANASGGGGATASGSGTSAATGSGTLAAAGPTTSPASVPTTAATAPTTTTAPPTTTAAPTTTAPPTTTTPPPTTTTAAPTTTTPPPVTSTSVAAAPTVTSTSAKPSPTPRSAITVGGVTTRLATTAAAANGLPAKAGVWARAGRPVVRLAAASAAVGSTVTLQLGAGAATSYTVASSDVLTTAQAAAEIAGAPAGELIILAPTADGSWTVLTAT